MEEREILFEILKWEKLSGIQTLRQLLPNLLDTDDKRLLYELTNGKNGIKDIQTQLRMSAGTISGLWNIWHTNGILEKSGQKYNRIISLKEIGLL